MFIDASAFCAILLGEEDGPAFSRKIGQAELRLTSHLAIMETALALGRYANRPFQTGRDLITRMIDRAGIRVMDITAAELAIALDASANFGKGRHPAKLNMGDCFAYACAKSRNVPLLCKGNDFPQTDIELA